MSSEMHAIRLSLVDLDLRYFGGDLAPGPKGDLRGKVEGDIGPGVKIVALWDGIVTPLHDQIIPTAMDFVAVLNQLHDVSKYVRNGKLTVAAQRIDNNQRSNEVVVSYVPNPLLEPTITSASSFLSTVILKGEAIVGSVVSGTVDGKTVEVRLPSSPVGGPGIPYTAPWTLTIPGISEGKHTARVKVNDPAKLMFEASSEAAIEVEVNHTITNPLVIDYPGENDHVGRVFFARGRAMPSTGPIFLSVDGGEKIEAPMTAAGEWRAPISVSAAGTYELVATNEVTGEEVQRSVLVVDSNFSLDRCAKSMYYDVERDRYMAGTYAEGAGDIGGTIEMYRPGPSGTYSWYEVATVNADGRWTYNERYFQSVGKIGFRQKYRPANEAAYWDVRFYPYRRPDILDPQEGAEITLPYTLKGETYAGAAVLIHNRAGQLIARVPTPDSQVRAWEYELTELPEGENVISLMIEASDRAPVEVLNYTLTVKYA